MAGRGDSQPSLSDQAFLLLLHFAPETMALTSRASSLHRSHGRRGDAGDLSSHLRQTWGHSITASHHGSRASNPSSTLRPAISLSSDSRSPPRSEPSLG